MKTPKLIKKAKELFGDDGKKRRASAASIKVILKKLKKKEGDLRKKLSDADKGSSSRDLQKLIKVVVAQRKKGVAALKRAKKDE